jgi:hypothetical protein
MFLHKERLMYLLPDTGPLLNSSTDRGPLTRPVTAVLSLFWLVST